MANAIANAEVEKIIERDVGNIPISQEIKDFSKETIDFGYYCDELCGLYSE